MKVLSAVLALSLLVAGAMGAAETCNHEAGVDTDAFDHCADIGNTISLYYSYTDTQLSVCQVCECSSWFGVGFGGNGQDYVLTWVNDAGTAHDGGDYRGHQNTVEDADTADVTLAAGATSGTTFGKQGDLQWSCYTRNLIPNDNTDTPINVDDVTNLPWAFSNGDNPPSNPAQLADDGPHADYGSTGLKFSDPTYEPNGSGGEEESFDLPEEVLLYGAAAAGVLLLVGLGYMVKKNRDEVNGNYEAAGYGGGYGGHGGYDEGRSRGRSKGGRSHGSRSRGSRSRGRSRSHGSRGSRSRGRSHGTRY